MSHPLSSSQQSALAHVAAYAKARKDDARTAIQEVLYMSDIPYRMFEEAVAKLVANARVALHFHPDRPVADMKSVAEALLEQGIYKSQFETRISNGSVSAFAGGARDSWEHRMFGGAYQSDGATDRERPKYGALDIMRHPDGPAPRFGSCYFLLAPQVSRRCTFTYLDSHQDPKEKGTYDEFDDILAALLKDAFHQNFAIGERDLTPRKWTHHLLHDLELPFKDPSKREANRNLNHYIEAQVHGDVVLQDDVEILVADPSFKGTDVGDRLEQLCAKHAIDLHWHMGFAMRADEVPSDFRGPAMPSMAKLIARNDSVDAAAIGAAAADLLNRPKRWSGRGSYEEMLQELKYMWHILVRFGSPLARK